MSLEIKNVSKRFGMVQANKDISFHLEDGEVLAILGENGAGKTTMMRIIYGLETMDSGSIEVDGQPVTITSPKEAIHLGIGMVHQHFMLVNHFTVTQNMVLGLREKATELFNAEEQNARIRQVFDDYGFSMDPDVLVGDLPIGLQQRVEIMKALFKGAQTLVLDEPTAVLTPMEIQELFQTIRKLTAQGKSVIFISHKLDEVMEISDRVLVLRQGQVVGERRTAETTKEELIRMMIGRALCPAVKDQPDEALKRYPVLKLEDLCVRGEHGKQLRDVSFQVYNHEVLGIAGVDGNGQNELVEAITGLRKVQSGHVYLNGEEITNQSPRQVREHKLSHIPEDRHARGLILSMDLVGNSIMVNHGRPPFSRRGFLNQKQASAFARELIQDYQISTPNERAKAASLSGGNQQKVVVAREISLNPELLVAVKPTRGVDIGATEYIHQCILKEREKGKGVLLVSAELDEIMALSDRIVVMFNGEMTGCVYANQVTQDDLGAMMTGVSRDFSALSPVGGVKS